MSLLWIESFGGLDGSTLDRKYLVSGTGALTVVNPPGRRANAALRSSDGSDAYILIAIPVRQTITIGCAIRYDSFSGAGDDQPLRFYGPDGQLHILININPSGNIEIARSGTTLATGSTVLSEDVWYYLEVQLTIGNAGIGSYEVRLDGAVELGPTVADTQNGGTAEINNIQVGNIDNGGGAPSVDMMITDLYIFDDSGSTNNDFIASTSYDVHIESHLPVADGTVNDWIPLGGGSNFEEVNDASGPDEDTSYNSTDSAGNQELYDMGNIVNDPDSILGLQVNACSKRLAGPTHPIDDLIRSGGTDYIGSLGTYYPPNEYDVQSLISETDPDTGIAWTDTGFNAAEFGVGIALSPSPSTSLLSASLSPSPSLSASASPSTASLSISLSPSLSPSLSISLSPSISLSVSLSPPSGSPSLSPSAEIAEAQGIPVNIPTNL